MVHSFRPPWVDASMNDIIKEVHCFMKACTWESSEARAGNNRGSHFFCIAGPDRQNKQVNFHQVITLQLHEPSQQIPNLRPWGRKNKKVVDEFFSKGRLFARIK